VRLLVSNQGKCYDSSSLLLPVYDDIEFYFPNVFSPNNNGLNDGFGLSSSQFLFVKEYNLKIFNRWGELLFNSDQMEETWNGGKAPLGVYIWVAQIRDVYNVLHELKGVVEVLR
jgi:gliding motility-associated-like protein